MCQFTMSIAIIPTQAVGQVDRSVIPTVIITPVLEWVEAVLVAVINHKITLEIIPIIIITPISTITTLSISHFHECSLLEFPVICTPVVIFCFYHCLCVFFYSHFIGQIKSLVKLCFLDLICSCKGQYRYLFE